MNKIKRFTVFFLVSVIASCAGHRPMQKGKATDTKIQAPGNPKAVQHFIKGSINEMREDYKSALLDYSEALLYDSSSVTIYNKVAEQYIKLQKYDSAERLLQQAIRRFSDNIDSYQMLAAIYYARHDMDKAEGVFKRLIELDPDDVDSRYSLITIYLAQGKELDVANEYQKMIDMGYGTPEMNIQIGNIYLKNNLLDKATAIFRDLLDAYPDDERSYLGMAKLSMAQADTVIAINWYLKGIEKDASFTTCLEELRDLYIGQKKWGEAISLLQRSVVTDENKIENYLRLGELYYQKGDTARAHDEFMKTMQKFPDDFRAYYSIGYLYYQQDDWNAAEPYFKQSLEKNENFKNGWMLLGFIYLRNQRLDEGEEHFRKAVAIFPDDLNINFFLGSILNQKKKTDEAIPLLERCLQINPDFVDAIGTLAMILDEKKMFAQSDSLYERALELKPDNDLLMNNYSYSLTCRGQNLDFALDLAHRAVAADSTNGAYLDTLGWIYFKKGMYEKAITLLAESVAEIPDNATLLYHLGMAFYKKGDTEKARQHLQNALQISDRFSEAENARQVLAELKNSAG